MKSPKNKTFELQTELGMYCRTGLNEPKTSIQNHTFQYRRLVFNIIKDTLKTAFPIAKELIGKHRWKKTVSYFFENHKCQTPQVWKLPFEFYEFYTQNAFPFKKEFPFLLDLLLYEWLEIEIFMMEDLEIEPFTNQKELQSEILVPNPEIRIFPISYPFHIKNANEIKKKDKGQYFVTIHRDYFTKQVKFNDFSYPFVEMLLKINEESTSILQLEEIFSKYEKDQKNIQKEVKQFLDFSIENNLILGYKPI
ncbi:MAG: hypothetical protein C4K58_07625 [Flavobacteriaceae bacterium]|nr:MAG: hypothetical protein C4K58_07625 [Flavobacteriaceae bacterium]